MKIAILNQFYAPDLAPTGHMAASLAEHRAQLGDQVTVITGSGRYVPFSNPAEHSRVPNPRVIRLWTPGLGKTKDVYRILDYASFYLFTIARLISLPRQDLIISLTTPPFIVLAGVAHKILHRQTRLVLWVMDCYPEVLEKAGRIKSGGITSRLMRWLNRRIFRELGLLVCLDPAMEELLTRQYCPSDENLTSVVIPNWEPLAEFPPRLAARKEPRDPLVILYLGNAGHGHEFETVLRAAADLGSGPSQFLFVGGGAKWPELKQSVSERELTNVTLRDYVPKADTPALMQTADCALITLRDGWQGVISPSKLHSNLAMGLPVVYVGPAGSNVDLAIEKHGCGISLRHGEAERLAGFLTNLRRSPARYEELSAQARRAFEEDFSDQASLAKWDRALVEILHGIHRNGS